MRSPRDILASARTIAVVGASDDPAKPGHRIPAALRRRGWQIVPVNPNDTVVLGEMTYPSISALPEGVDVVEVFRPSDEAPEIVREVARRGIPAVWLQEGIVSEEAAALATANGLDYVENTCMGTLAHNLDIHAPK